MEALDVLLLEDEKDQRELLVTNLADESKGRFLVNAFSDSMQALAKLKDELEYQPRVVISDYRLPGQPISGLQFLRQAKKLRPNAFLILYTSESAQELQEMASEAGVCYINKQEVVPRLLYARIKQELPDAA